MARTRIVVIAQNELTAVSSERHSGNIMIRKTPYLFILFLLVACGDDGDPGTPPDAALPGSPDAADSPDATPDSPDAEPSAPPTLSDQQVTTAEDTAVEITIEADYSGNVDIEFILEDPPNGSITGTLPGVITYTPDEDFNGTDTFEVDVSDGAVTNSATITVTVTPVNDAPVASEDAYVVLGGIPVEVELLATDVDGDSLTYTIVTQPENGTVTGEGSVQIYTHDDGFTGQDSFTFRVNDGQLDSNIATFGIVVITPGVAPRPAGGQR